MHGQTREILDDMKTLDRERAHFRDILGAWARGETQVVAAPEDLDRERFQTLLTAQQAFPSLAGLVDPQALTPQAQSLQSQALEIARRRTTIMLLELERVLPALAARRCRPIVLKGASLALMVYPRPEDRWFLDLDLLVEPRDLETVYDALATLGYRFARTVCPVRYYEDHHFHRILISNQGICIEVHWALTMPASVYSYDLAALRNGCLEVPLGGTGFLAPSFPDQILHGVLQSIAGGFGDLRRILDLHLLDARLDDDDRLLLCSRARVSNLAIGLWLQYHLREQLLQEPLPGVVEQTCRPHSRLVRLLDGLEVAGNCLLPAGKRLEGYDYLLHCLCLPPEFRSHEAWRYLFPDQRGLLEAGLGHDGRIPPVQRARLHLGRLRSALRLLSRVARASLGRGGGSAVPV
jgi:hypothetical protein